VGFTVAIQSRALPSPLVGRSVVFGRTQGRQRLVGRSGYRRTNKMMPPYRNPGLSTMSLRVEEPTRRRLIRVGMAPRAELSLLGSLCFFRPPPRVSPKSVGRSRTPRTPGRSGLAGWSAILRTVRDFGCGNLVKPRNAARLALRVTIDRVLAWLAKKPPPPSASISQRSAGIQPDPRALCYTQCRVVVTADMVAC
jgi:hypothetical protein